MEGWALRSARCVVISALLLLTGALGVPLAGAAGNLLGYQLSWQPDRSLSIQGADGHTLRTLEPGQRMTIRHGSDVLTLSLQRPTAMPVPAPAATRHVAQMLLRAINRDRALHHAAPLVLDTQQSVCSLAHSRHMASVRQISQD